MILVTGGTGHIGNVLVKELAKGDVPVRALLLPDESLRSLTREQIEIVRGDITDYKSLQKAFQGVKKVFHLGSIAVTCPRNPHHIFDVNVNGFHNILTACFEFNIQKLIYVNSIHSFEILKNNDVLIEKKDFYPLKLKNPCSKSKALAAQDFFDAVKKGLPGIMLHPVEVIGPYDYAYTHFTQMLQNYLKGKIIPYVNGFFNFIDVRDSVNAIINAGEKGIVGENYILAGEKVSFNDIFKYLADITHIHPKIVKIPYFKAKFMSYFTDLFFAMRKIKPTFTPFSIYNLQTNYDINSTKAKRDFNFTNRDLKQTLFDIVEWIKNN